MLTSFQRGAASGVRLRLPFALARHKGSCAQPPSTPLTQFAELDRRMAALKAAQDIFATYSQKQVDEIFSAVALEANAQRLPLARAAVVDTRMGVFEDKVIKNHFASEIVHNSYRHTRTCDIIEEDVQGGVMKFATPVGPILALIPVTNPTSTTVYKSLLALKTRNAIMFAPHPRAAKCTAQAAEVIRRAAVAAGAPEGIIQVIDTPDRPTVDAAMHHPVIQFLIATGGGAMVKACYSSGKPAIGVGPGNVPALIDETANIQMAVSSIVMSKSFDNGTTCACENSIVAVQSILPQLKKELMLRGGFVLSKEDTQKISDFLYRPDQNDPHHHTLNNDVVGQSAVTIAKMAGITVPSDTLVLVADKSDGPVDMEDPLSHEKLCPVLTLYSVPNFKAAVDAARNLVHTHGAGHSGSLFTNPINHDRVNAFQTAVPASRIMVDMPAIFGAIGDLYNFRLAPALTLGCGTKGGNSFSGNVGPMSLLNVRTTVETRENMLWFKCPPAIYFKPHILTPAFTDLTARGIKSVFIVTDNIMGKVGILDQVTSVLAKMGIPYKVFDQVTPDPTSDCIALGVERLRESGADCVMALGGGSPIDAAKVIRLMYEHPEMKLSSLVTRFMDIRKRVVTFPELGSKIKLVVAIPTTSGTGAEVTPFAVITDSATGRKYPIASYRLTPDVAIVDASLAASMPPRLVSHTTFDAITHAIECYVSVVATDFTRPLAIRALQLLVPNSTHAYKTSVARAPDLPAFEACHHGSLLAGMAFGNAFLGICHSMAHALGSAFHIPHGLANAYVLPYVIRFNSTQCPTRRAAFAQYKFYRAQEDYGEIAVAIGVAQLSDSLESKVDKLVAALETIKANTGIASSIAAGEPHITEAEYAAKISEMADFAFDDQCTGANPRYPFLKQLEQLFWDVYRGKSTPM